MKKGLLSIFALSLCFTLAIAPASAFAATAGDGFYGNDNPPTGVDPNGGTMPDPSENPTGDNNDSDEKNTETKSSTKSVNPKTGDNLGVAAAGLATVAVASAGVAVVARRKMQE